MLPAPLDDSARDELATAVLDKQSWTLPAQPSTSVTIPPPPGQPVGPRMNVAGEAEHAPRGIAQRTLEEQTELEAILAQLVKPQRWLSGWRSGEDDYVFPAFARWVLFVVPSSVVSATAVKLGPITYTLPVGPNVTVLPTLRSTQLSWPGGVTEIQFQVGNLPEDVDVIRSYAL